jgi:hypothetical protein
MYSGTFKISWYCWSLKIDERCNSVVVLAYTYEAWVSSPEPQKEKERKSLARQVEEFPGESGGGIPTDEWVPERRAGFDQDKDPLRDLDLLR